MDRTRKKPGRAGPGLDWTTDDAAGAMSRLFVVGHLLGCSQCSSCSPESAGTTPVRPCLCTHAVVGAPAPTPTTAVSKPKKRPALATI
nr:unnamed protein product [Digitaria exilis]